MSDSSYAWIIDQDTLPDPSFPEGTNCNARGVIGPRGANPEYVRLLQESESNGTAFRLCWDDCPPDHVAYYGRILWDPAEFEARLAPLDDFGMPNAGCVSIEYRNDRGQWRPI